MVSHQDLKPGHPEANMSPGYEFGDRDESGEQSSRAPGRKIGADAATSGADVHTSGTQPSPRGDSDLRINYGHPTEIRAGSNRIGGSWQQGMYCSTFGAVTWGETTLPLPSGALFHSKPTVDWSSD